MEGNDDECLFCKFDIVLATMFQMFSHDVLFVAGEEPKKKVFCHCQCLTKELQLHNLCFRFTKCICNCHFCSWRYWTVLRPVCFLNQNLRQAVLTTSVSRFFLASWQWWWHLSLKSITSVQTEVSQQISDEEDQSCRLLWSPDLSA